MAGIIKKPLRLRRRSTTKPIEIVLRLRRRSTMKPIWVINYKNKKYAENNKEAIEIYKKNWYNLNKQKISKKNSTRIKCECGLYSTKTNLKRHQRTAKHKRLMDALTK